MPIVSNLIESTTNADGSRHVVVRMYDQDSKEYTISFFAPVGFDVNASVTNRIAEMNIQLAEAEFEALVGG